MPAITRTASATLIEPKKEGQPLQWIGSIVERDETGTILDIRIVGPLWDSHRDAHKHAQDYLDTERARESERRQRTAEAAEDLLTALEALYASYKSLADSGDAGNWVLEELPEGIQALNAIRKAKGT